MQPKTGETNLGCLAGKALGRRRALVMKGSQGNWRSQNYEFNVAIEQDLLQRQSARVYKQNLLSH